MSSTKKLSGQALEEAIENNKFIYDEYFDAQYSHNVVHTIMNVADTTYFRSELVGFEEIPERNNPEVPLIYAGNHSGMAFPWDAMIFGSLFYRRAGNSFKNAVRPLSAPMLSQSKLMNPYLVPNMWKRVGAVDATSLNFETMMRQNDANLLIYPEGVPGIGKGFNNRYQLQKFSTSFIRMSIKYKTDIIPVHTINGEYIHPYSYAFKSINKLVNKLGVPFLPISLILPAILLQPWLFYHAFPAKLVYVKGERISPYKWIDKPFEEITKEEFAQIRDRVQEQMQKEMDAGVEKYGKNPYQWGSLWKSTKKNIKNFPFSYPFGWPLVFMEFMRRWKAQGEKGELIMDFSKVSFWKTVLKNPLYLAYFIPILGWLPLGYIGFKGRDTNVKVWEAES